MEEDDDDDGMLKQAISMSDEINRNCSDMEKRIVTKKFSDRTKTSNAFRERDNVKYS